MMRKASSYFCTSVFVGKQYSCLNNASALVRKVRWGTGGENVDAAKVEIIIVSDKLVNY